MPLSPRSALFLPASNARAIEKVRTLACDAIILDLEDAVAPEEKPDARRRAVAAVAAGGFGDRLVAVRVNAPDTPWFVEDLEALRSVTPDALVVPKVASTTDLERVRRHTDRPLWAMIETCAGVLHLDRLSEDAGRLGLTALIAGTNDLAIEMRCRPGADRVPLLPALSRIVIAARAAGLIALDGVRNAIDDPEGLVKECAQGAALGFDGKTLIHPAQIDAANFAFLPTHQEIAHARAVIAAFDDPANHRRGAIRIGSTMVERLHLAAAERVMRAAERERTTTSG